MIAVDASALVAIVLAEPEKAAFGRVLTEYDCIIGAPTALEARLAIAFRTGVDEHEALRRLLRLPNLEIVPFSDLHADVAFVAFDRYGRGRHPAKLNFGDCMAYAVAKLAKAPLLFKGDDFAQTDIAAVFPQSLPKSPPQSPT